MTAKYDVKINSPFTCLNSLFVNGNGQLADNLETSRSPRAVAVREKREAEEQGFKTVEDLKKYQRQELLLDYLAAVKRLQRERDEVLKAGVKLAHGLLRTNKFRRANTLASQIRDLKEKIILLKKEI